jgi:hypothetical protein
MSNSYKIGPANRFSPEHIAFIKKTVLAAGQVNMQAFDRLVLNDPILIIYPNETDIKAVGALKKPNIPYRSNVFEKANSLKDPNYYKYELGWVVSLEKGNGRKITELLSSYTTNIYATTRDDNIQMKKILSSVGFVKSGSSYKSERGDYYISLYINE